MTEFEQCMVMTLKDIKSQLSGINDGLYSISNQLKTFNENHEVDWTYDIHKDLEGVNKSLELIHDIIVEKA